MKWSSTVRKWSRLIHRDLSFFFSGMVLIYAISGIVMNHRDTINPNFSITRKEYKIAEKLPDKAGMSKDKREDRRSGIWIRHPSPAYRSDVPFTLQSGTMVDLLRGYFRYRPYYHYSLRHHHAEREQGHYRQRRNRTNSRNHDSHSFPFLLLNRNNR